MYRYYQERLYVNYYVNYAGAGAVGADTFWSEPEPEPEP